MASKAVILLCLMAIVGQLWAIPRPMPYDDDGMFNILAPNGLVLFVSHDM